MYTFKCTSKPSSICMTPRDDNGEQAFCQIFIPFTFDEFSKVLSLYEYVYVGVDDEIIQYNNVLRVFIGVEREGSKADISGLAQSQFQPY